MVVIKSLILILALAAPLSAIKCIQCAEYDDSKTDAIQKQKIDSWSGELLDKCSATSVATNCSGNEDACYNIEVESKLGGSSSMTLKLKDCGEESVKDVVCDEFKAGIAKDKAIVIDGCEASVCKEDGCNSTPKDLAEDTPKDTTNDTAKDSGTTLTASVLMITAFLAWLAL